MTRRLQPDNPLVMRAAKAHVLGFGPLKPATLLAMFRSQGLTERGAEAICLADQARRDRGESAVEGAERILREAGR